ncbi:unnamed protein product, partial [Lymnaea stagnalis]
CWRFYKLHNRRFCISYEQLPLADYACIHYRLDVFLMLKERKIQSMAGTDSYTEDEKRSKFGTRFLTDPQNVFKHNAWDNVVWDEEQEAEAKKIAVNHANHAVSQEKKDQLEREAAKHWDQFYSIHSNHFFKDRHWLFTEFPELYGGEKHFINSNRSLKSENALLENTESKTGQEYVHTGDKKVSNLTSAYSSDSSQLPNNFEKMQVSSDQWPKFALLEVGCGVGNTVFPVLKTNKNPYLKIYCCDFSSTAIDIVKTNPDYDKDRCHAFVHDITDEQADIPVEVGSLNVIIMIFVLSAVAPEKMQAAVNRLSSFLKPGGTFLFRDYGRYDMAQLRFKEGRCLSENFYVRGDGTRVYFFTQGELSVVVYLRCIAN